MKNLKPLFAKELFRIYEELLLPSKQFLIIGILLAVFLISSGGILIAFNGGRLLSARAEGETAYEGYIAVNSYLDLVKIGRHEQYPIDGNYVLTSDIELPYPGRAKPAGSEFDELTSYISDYFLLGSGSNRRWRGWLGVDFNGTFDGNGFAIKGLAGDRKSAQTSTDTIGPVDYHGLFRSIAGTVRNLRLTSGASTGEFRNFSGLYMTGVLTGVLNGTVENCHIEGVAGTTLEATEITGGIAAYFQGGTILNCTVKNLNFVWDYWAGGITGYMTGGHIVNSGAECTFSSGNGIGGITGIVQGDVEMLIENCYAGGAVTSERPSGGIVSLYQAPNSFIKNCFSYLKPQADFAGKSDGVVREYDAGNIADCYSAVEDGGATARGTTLSKTVIQSEFFVNNVLNSDKTTFTHRNGQYPSVNLNPVALNKAKINVNGAIEAVNGSAYFLNRETMLTPGNYALKIRHADELLEYALNVDESAANANGAVNLYFITFYTGLAEKIETIVAQEGFNPQDYPSPNPGMLFDGWFTERTGGELLTQVSGDCTLWAHNVFVELSGSCPAGTLITLSAITLSDGSEGSFEPLSKTTDTGLFSYSALKLGFYRLTFEKDGYQTGVSDVELNAGQTNAGNIVLTPVTVAGRAADYCKVTLLDSLNNVVNSLTTGYEGNFSFGTIKDGKYFVRFEKTSFRVRTIEITVSRQSVSLNEKAGEEQIALSQIMLTGTSKSGSTVALTLNNVLVGSVLIDESGTFSFAGVANAVYTLTATLETYVTQTASVIVSGGADAEHHFTLDEQVAISGRTTAKTKVELWLNGTLIGTVNTDAYGDYSFMGLTAGDYTLIFVRERHIMQQHSISIADQSVADGLYLLERNESDVPAYVGYIIEGAAVLAIAAGIYIALSARNRKRKNKNS